MVDVAVVGQVARHVALAVDRFPDAGGAARAGRRHEGLGAAANQAIGARQLGCSAAVVGVVGDDAAGTALLADARRDGIGTAGLVRRVGATTALFVDVVEPGGRRRVLAHVPDDVVLTADDVRAARPTLEEARAVLVHLKQPAPVVLDAVGAAARGGGLVVLDGAHPDPDVVRRAVAAADVVRADADQAGVLLGWELADVDAAVAAAAELLAQGPSLVALAAAEEANVVAWDGGHVVLPLLDQEPVDVTGAGDAFLVGLVVALLDGRDPETAGWWGAVAAASTTQRLGGRPALEVGSVARGAQTERRAHARS
ncbi:PfkB family carbohydrate kinase [Cellulomonas sp. NPDC057328]|uniref:PfkB family carbohydrate kinase n=1 Tax=Cellulomonas sp. NPDC057328 TaxID=3346101 RepID=UPI003631C118